MHTYYIPNPFSKLALIFHLNNLYIKYTTITIKRARVTASRETYTCTNRTNYACGTVDSVRMPFSAVSATYRFSVYNFFD